MIRAVVVDLDGVVFSEGKSVALDKLAAVSGNHRRLVGAILASPQGIWLRQGLIRDSEFRHRLHQQLRSNYDWRLIKNQWYDRHLFDEYTYVVIANLRKICSFIAFSGNEKSTTRTWRGNTTFAI
jgi:hypothetical protein